jgi:hypothetical protein
MAVDKAALVAIVGSDRVSDEEQTLVHYARDQSFAPARRPDFIVFAETVEEIQKLVRLACSTRTPLIPYSSGLNFHGAAVPDQCGIILDMSRMNKIMQIDESNWIVIIEPGVTYEQLQRALLQKGYRLMVPFGVPPGRSVLTSYLERDPVLAAPCFEAGNSLIMDTELVLPNGEVFRTGKWCLGGTPGGFMGPIRNIIYRLWTGAQGTLGIMTKMGIALQPFIRERKIYYIAFEELAAAIEPVRRIQRREIGLECFLLNRFNLAALFSDEWQTPELFPASPSPSPSFEALRATLPAWTLIICLNGGFKFPEKKINYEEEALAEVCSQLNQELRTALPGVQGCNDYMLDQLIHPWGILKKFNFCGSVHDLNFKSPLQDIGAMQAVIETACESGGYDPAALGAYLLPLERGRAMHCEFDLHCDLSDAPETAKVKQIWRAASEALMNSGAVFDRPYGAWAEMVYRRAGTYTEKLKQVKAEIDAAGIMNPGKLCF